MEHTKWWNLTSNKEKLVNVIIVFVDSFNKEIIICINLVWEISLYIIYFK